MDAAAIEALATRFFTAIEAGDLPGVRACYADDAVIWHNTDGRAQDVTANLRVLGWLMANMADRRYEDVSRVVVADGFVQQHVLRGTAPGGEPFELPAMMRVWTADGRVTRLDEYFDSAHVTALIR